MKVNNSILKSTAGITSLLMGFQVVYADNPGENRPNLVFAIADDWGWPHAPSYGDNVVKTPNFERIAAEGLIFKNAFVSAPSCTPSRNAILTGEYHWRLGTGGNLWSIAPVGHPTFPNILEDNGYLVGNYRKAYGPGNDGERPLAGKKYKSPEEFFSKRKENQPFCFWFGSSDPHRGYKWQSGINSGMKLEDVQVPPCFPDHDSVRTDICDYYYEVQRFDREFGNILKLLDSIGELNNTIIIMTGDHGWPFPRGKSNLYDLGTHVPLAIQWGDKIKKGRIIDDFVSFTDFAPTFLEAAGIPPLKTMTGKSLMNILMSDKPGNIDPDRNYVITGKERHTPCQIGHMGGTPMRAIRNKDYLYIHNFEPDRWPAGAPDGTFRQNYGDIDNGPTKSYILAHKDEPGMKKFFELSCSKRPEDELYDLDKDPYQLNNVAGDPDYKKVLVSLKKKLFKELKASNDPRMTKDANIFDSYEYLGRVNKK